MVELPEDAPNTPFPAKALFYVVMASGTVILLGAVFAYVL